MKANTDQTLARHCLAHRNGYSITRVVRQAKLRYIFILAILVAFVFVLNSTIDPMLRALCVFAVGMLLGAVARDFVWLRQIKKNWPFNVRIIDWKKVEEIAAGEEDPKYPARPQ